MDMSLIVRVVAAIAFVVVLGILVVRRKKSLPDPDRTGKTGKRRRQAGKLADHPDGAGDNPECNPGDWDRNQDRSRGHRLESPDRIVRTKGARARCGPLDPAVVGRAHLRDAVSDRCDRARPQAARVCGVAKASSLENQRGELANSFGAGVADRVDRSSKYPARRSAAGSANFARNLSFAASAGEAEWTPRRTNRVYGCVEDVGGTPREIFRIRNSCSNAVPPPAARPINEFSIVSPTPRSLAG